MSILADKFFAGVLKFFIDTLESLIGERKESAVVSN